MIWLLSILSLIDNIFFSPTKSQIYESLQEEQGENAKSILKSMASWSSTPIGPWSLSYRLTTENSLTPLPADIHPQPSVLLANGHILAHISSQPQPEHSHQLSRNLHCPSNNEAIMKQQCFCFVSWWSVWYDYLGSLLCLAITLSCEQWNDCWMCKKRAIIFYLYLIQSQPCLPQWEWVLPGGSTPRLPRLSKFAESFITKSV